MNSDIETTKVVPTLLNALSSGMIFKRTATIREELPLATPTTIPAKRGLVTRFFTFMTWM